jgi:hypothetical protein
VNRASKSAQLSELSVDIESSVACTIGIDANVLNHDWVHVNESNILEHFDISIDALRS